jgi:acyl-CoA synthetase (AMP-forming)/AMP-acid ligase II
MAASPASADAQRVPCTEDPRSPDAAPAVWGDQISVEAVHGVPFRMYSNRPHQVNEVLALAHRWQSRPYVVQGAREVSFEGLLAGVERKARHLEQGGVAAGDRVLILGWNSPDWIVNFWACQQLGAVPALANAWWGETEIVGALDLLQPAAALADDRGARKLPAGCSRASWQTDTGAARAVGSTAAEPLIADEEAPAVIIFTSGTAGRPKAVELSHRSLLANLQMLLQVTQRLPHEVDEQSGEIALHTGPLFHVGGPQMLMRSIAVGNTLVLPSGRFDPGEILELIERHEVTRWAAVPTMVSRVLDHPDLHRRDLRSLRALTIGGAPVHAELVERIGRELPGVQAGVPTGYGLTENGGQATAASGRDTLKHPGSAGRPLPCAELRFEPRQDLPDPEVLIRSPTQMTRYIGVGESPIDSEGWLHTGDLGHLDDEGRLWITGRAKDLIIRGGENVAPAAVERALTSISGVLEAAVVGVPHPDLGEEVCAFVVVADGRHTGETLSRELRGQLASFAVPSVWHLQQQPLPTNQTGKIDKQALVTRTHAAEPGADTGRADGGRSGDPSRPRRTSTRGTESGEC